APHVVLGVDLEPGDPGRTGQDLVNVPGSKADPTTTQPGGRRAGTHRGLDTSQPLGDSRTVLAFGRVLPAERVDPARTSPAGKRPHTTGLDQKGDSREDLSAPDRL